VTIPKLGDSLARILMFDRHSSACLCFHWMRIEGREESRMATSGRDRPPESVAEKAGDIGVSTVSQLEILTFSQSKFPQLLCGIIFARGIGAGAIVLLAELLKPGNVFMLCLS
jgi:hypothetical protein